MPSLTSPSAGITGRLQGLLCIYLWAGDLNSGPQAWEAITEPSPWLPKIHSWSVTAATMFWSQYLGMGVHICHLSTGEVKADGVGSPHL